LFRNLVSCCLNCNSRKSDLPAADFLRQLFREGRLSAKDLSARLLAVQALAGGKLRPQVFREQNAGSKSRIPVSSPDARRPPRSPAATPWTLERI